MGVCFCHFNGYEVKDAAARAAATELEGRATELEGRATELEGRATELENLFINNGDGCYYRMVDGEKEWINPPLELERGEYRTTERWNGKPVYVTLQGFPDSLGMTADYLEAETHPFGATVFDIQCCVIDGGADGGSSTFMMPLISETTHRVMMFTSSTPGYEKGTTTLKFLDGYEHEDDRIFIFMLKYIKEGLDY